MSEDLLGGKWFLLGKRKQPWEFYLFYASAFRRRRHYVFGMSIRLSIRPSVRSLKYPLLTCTWVRWSTRPTVTVLWHVRPSASMGLWYWELMSRPDLAVLPVGTLHSLEWFWVIRRIFIYSHHNTFVFFSKMSVRQERFPGISWRTHGGNGLKFCTLIYLDHLQNWLVYGYSLLIFLILALFWLSETGQIWGFRAFPGECMVKMAWNITPWCILSTFRTD